MGQEIERKFLVSGETANTYIIRKDSGEYVAHEIEQAYLTTDPVIRVRKSDDKYYLTYKGSGLMSREEYNLPLTAEAYNTLKSKAEGNVIKKTRILIPYDTYTIELDIFKPPFEHIYMAEVEFDSEEEACAFVPPDWFLNEVTDDRNYHNSVMSRMKLSKNQDLSPEGTDDSCL